LYLLLSELSRILFFGEHPASAIFIINKATLKEENRPATSGTGPVDTKNATNNGTGSASLHDHEPISQRKTRSRRASETVEHREEMGAA